MSLEYVEYFNIFGEEVAQVPSILGNGKPEDQIDNILVQRAEPGCLYMDRLSGDLYKQVELGQWKLISGSGVLVTDPEQNGNIIFETGEPGESGGLPLLAVTYEFDPGRGYNVASHTPQQIYNYIQKGGNVALILVNAVIPTALQVTMSTLDRTSFQYASDDYFIQFYEILEDRRLVVYELQFAEYSVIGDISTALDELHAYAEALKGGDVE